MKGSTRKYVDRKCLLCSTKFVYIYMYIYIYIYILRSLTAWWLLSKEMNTRTWRNIKKYSSELNERYLDSILICPVGWGCRIHRLHLCRGVRTPPPTSVLDMTLKQSIGEVPAMLELWGMRSTPLLPSLPGPLWSGVVAPDRALSMG